MGIIFGYPKNPGTQYTGCVHLWVAEDAKGEDWGLKMTTYFVNGQPAIYLERIQETGRGEGEIRLECRYEHTQVTFEKLHPEGSASSHCPEASMLRKALDGPEQKQTR